MAIKNKYGEVIKSEEYLEKVFEVSFSIPRTFSLNSFLLDYFPGHHDISQDFLIRH